MSKAKKNTKTIKPAKPVKKAIKISHEEGRETLYYIEDIFGAASIPYFVRGKTLKSINKGKMLEDPIELGVRNRYLTEFGMGVLKANFILKIVTKRGKMVELKTKHNKVPIHIKVYHRNYAMIKSLDNVIYDYDMIPVPNPADKFIRVDGMLK